MMSSLQERLFRRSEKAALRLGESSDRDGSLREHPEPGDLFAFPETAEIQWAILERDPADGRLWIVPADVHPAIGSADVAVPPESACGALSLRCGFGFKLEADTIDMDDRVGSLPSTVLLRAREKRAALDEGLLGSASEQETDREPESQDVLYCRSFEREADIIDMNNRVGLLPSTALLRAREKRAALDEGLLGSASEQETDREPKYQDLMRELEWAKIALQERRKKAGLIRIESTARGSEGEVGPLWRLFARGESTSKLLALAATALLAVSLALLAGLSIGRSRVEKELRPHITNLERRLAEADNTEPFSPMALWFSRKEDVRGIVKSVTMPPEKMFLVLSIEISDPEPYPKYQLNVREKDTGIPVHRHEEPGSGITDISVVLPRGALDAGEFELKLYGLRDDEAKLIDEYGLRVELE